MAGLTLLFSTILVSFLTAQSCLCYRPLRDNNYRQTSIDDSRRYIDGFLDSARYRGQSITTDTNHHETTLSYVHDQQQHGTFNVLDYGAVGEGRTDSANAFLKAWEDFCGATGEPTLMIPYGKVFLITPVSFQGPCNSQKLQIQLQGTIIAPGSVNAWRNNKNANWIQIVHVNGLTINGGGQIDGQGHLENESCTRPTALSFHGCNNLHLNSIHHVNSQRNHISLNACNAVEISHVRIMAPEYSPNTDGIDISASSHLNIHDSVIGTGDDCIAINGFSSNINISRVMCGPGHGISIGSLGKNGAYETVEDVHVRDCTFTDTMNGARIKTWKGGRGYVRRVSFEDITLVNAGNPIVIEQAYTGRRASSREDISSGDHVEISKVTYRGVVGTSSDERAVYFNCGGGSGCKDIVMDNVEIKSAVEGKQLFAVCNNAHGSSRADLSPKVSCLMP